MSTEIEKILKIFLEFSENLKKAKNNKAKRSLYQNNTSGFNKLAEQEGIILCYANKKSVEKAKLASKNTVEKVMNLAQNRAYANLLPGATSKLDDVYEMLKGYGSQGVNWNGVRARAYVEKKLKDKYENLNQAQIQNIIGRMAFGNGFNNRELTRVDGVDIDDIDNTVDTRLLPDGMYTEWDASLGVGRPPNLARGPERFVRGGGKVYYTGEHYATFVRIK